MFTLISVLVDKNDYNVFELDVPINVMIRFYSFLTVIHVCVTQVKLKH